jgi:Eco57I restriction-modification methylase
MIPGISGSLLSTDALERVVPAALAGRLDEQGRERAQRRLRAWHQTARIALGPSASERSVFDRLAAPLMGHLGYRSIPVHSREGLLSVLLEADGRPAALLLVTPWGLDSAAAWRRGVTHGIAFDQRWCLCLSGPALRVIDSGRTYARRFVEFDLETAVDDPRTFAVFWGLLRAAAMSRHADRQPLIERAVALSEQHRSTIRESLQRGVEDALSELRDAFTAARAARPAPKSVDEPLVIVYRVLFLLFAEARGLVPMWHPVFRDSYTIEALRTPAERLPRPRGIWESLQATARLAHRGCRAGALRVTPFNGRLFSPADAPLADALPLDDGAVRRALMALTTRKSAAGRERISYADLGVEQLGGVYERLLDLRPAHAAGEASRRKATGSFYTPRALTEFVVRRTLAPLVEGASPEQILALRVLDPAMGSGAFLVAACRYLATAYEHALCSDTGAFPSEITDADRTGFRRTIAQRCLFGVDVNPMAVQLARLSLWLATLAADKPLTFLDHRLRTANSVIGASPDDVARLAPGRHARSGLASLPLFADETAANLCRAIEVRLALATEPGDTLDEVRAKERALAGLNHLESPLARLRRVSDVWCAAWFAPPSERRSIQAAFPSIVDDLVRTGGMLPRTVSSPIVDRAAAVAAEQQFFHWTLEFPEIFYDSHGRPRSDSGFDAVLGNPPWEMLRADAGGSAEKQRMREALGRVAGFVRGSATYRHQGAGHPNLFQLFLERAMNLTRDGGRIGLILPSGISTDRGCASLRRAVLDRTTVDTFIGFENRDGVFPIHRGLKFVIATATRGGRTAALPCRFGVRRAEVLDGLPDAAGSRDGAISVPRSLLEAWSGDELAIPELRTAGELDLVARLVSSVPALGGRDGWNVSFGRELNATDDRRHLAKEGPGIPVLEGKHIEPFAVDLSSAAFRIPRAALSRFPAVERASRYPRLAYRDVASASNRLTLIAAIIPRETVTTHTLFCIKQPADQRLQQFLCAIFNSFVANFLVRLRVGTHVTAGLVAQLPVPKPPRSSPIFDEVVSLGAALCADPRNTDALARLQARVAHLYGVREAELRHILDSFPLVPREERDAVARAFCAIVG